MTVQPPFAASRRTELAGSTATLTLAISPVPAGRPHGIATTHQDRDNADLLAFIRG